jgi:hypothetical protein
MGVQRGQNDRSVISGGCEMVPLEMQIGSIGQQYNDEINSWEALPESKVVTLNAMIVFFSKARVVLLNLQ